MSEKPYHFTCDMCNTEKFCVRLSQVKDGKYFCFECVSMKGGGTTTLEVCYFCEALLGSVHVYDLFEHKLVVNLTECPECRAVHFGPKPSQTAWFAAPDQSETHRIYVRVVYSKERKKP